jgi:hypothetical protein
LRNALCYSYCRNPDGGKSPWCCTKETCVDGDPNSWDYCDVCVRSPPPPPPPSPKPPPPTPPPPSPPPPTPPACPFEVQPSQCWNQGATLDNCADYFYENQIGPGDFRQCLWGPSGCRAGGFSCDAKQQGKPGCNCPAKCPKKLPFVPGAVGSNCKYQGASKNNCDRCP